MLHPHHNWALLACLGLSACGSASAPSLVASPEAQEQTRPAADSSTCDTSAECERQCDSGNASSCEWLGHMHETGDGTPQSYEKAARYYDQACEAGLDESCAHLAMMYDIGLAVEEDPARASRLYQKACDAGNRWACKRSDEIETP